MDEDLKYWLRNKDKKPLYINAATNVEAGVGFLRNDGKPANLQSSPTGWKETLIKWTRSIKNFGLFREYSAPLTVVKDFAKIAKDAFWKIGIEAELYLEIRKLNREVFPDTYEDWYMGELDFSKFKQGDDSCQLMLVEGGLSKYLKSYEGTTYEMRIDTDPERFSVYMDGLTFKNNIEYSIYNQNVYSPQFIGGNEYWEIGMGIVSAEGTTQGIITQDQQIKIADSAITTNSFHFSKTKTYVAHIDGFLNYGAYTDDAYFGCYIQKTNLAGASVAVYNIVPDTTVAENSKLNAPFSFDIPMNPDEYLFLRVHTPAGGIGDPAGAINIFSGQLNVTYDVRFDPTLCECISWFTLFKRLVEKITDGKYGCKSTFLQNMTDQCVTSGQAIRKYLSPAVIKTSFEDFYKACKRWGLGMDIINNELVIEPYEFFFRKGIAIELGDIILEDAGPAEDLIINTIKTGYKNQEYDKVNGRDEPNVTQTYTTPITRIVKELDLICPYRADMFGIELTRLELYGKDTTDSSADNDTFMMNVIKGTTYDYYRGVFKTVLDGSLYFIEIPTVLFQLPNGRTITFDSSTFTIIGTSYLISGYTRIQVIEPVINDSFNEEISTYDADVYKLNRPAYSSITGLINPAEAFNTELTPKHALLNNKSLLASLLDKQEMGSIIFRSGEKNSLLSTTLAGVTVTQNADISIATLGPKLFKPYYFKFKTKVPINLLQIMNTQPYDLIGFTINGNKYYGYMWAGGVQPATMEAQDFQLLSSPDNDLTKMI